MKSSYLLAAAIMSAAAVAYADDAPLTLASLDNSAAPTLDAPVLTLADAAASAPKPYTKGAPLPVHTIEGYGGLAVTPMAYLVNPGDPASPVALPSVSATYVNLGSKNLESFAITETLFQRIELGYAAARFDIGNTRGDIQNATTVDVGQDVWLHNFNVRGLIIPENTWCKFMPAVTVGAHFKYNDGISAVNRSLGGLLNSLGYARCSGTDFTLTATKMFTEFGRPVIVSAGLRESQSSHAGFFGFSKDWSLTFEGNVSCLVLDNVLVAYEFRQKTDPYNQVPGLIEGEDNWHAIDVAWIINNHATLTAGWGTFGTMLNSEADCAWWLQFKYEF